jgi:superfamily II DNA or RNA helicase
MDANTEIEERREIGEKFARREIEVVTNVGVLTTGIDWDVRCISLVRPTRSEMLFQQIIGRGLRTAPGKDYCLILDHSDTHLKLGFVTDVDARNLELDGGQKKPSAPKPKKERLPSECPSCHALRPAHARKCPACGFAPVKQNDVEHEDVYLAEFEGKKEKFTREQNEQFYGELLIHAPIHNYKPGWAANKFKERMGVWPNKFRYTQPKEPTPETVSWIKASQIRWAKRKTA